MSKKVVIAGISSILLVAILIGIIASTTHPRSSKPAGGQLTTNSRSISAFCHLTVYTDLCERTLRSGGINESSTSGDIIRAAVNVITTEVQSANQKAHDLHSQAKTSIDNDGFVFCKDLLDDAGDKLAAVIAEADNAHRNDDLQAWLSMIISYRTNCLASIEAPDLNGQMTDALRNTTELADNAIAVVTAVGELAQQFNVTGEGVTKSGGRRLLWNGEYPTWLTAGDRKMLGSGVVKPNHRPNAVVAKDGSGQFKSINDALNAMPRVYRGRYVIYVKAGVYYEKVTVGKDKPNVLIYGDGPRKSIVSGGLCNAQGIGTWKTSTFSVEAPGFIAWSMGFSNTAGPEGHQAVALRLRDDAAVIYNCRIDGFQDSFYTQSGRHFVRSTTIAGTVDFIFGDSQVVIQNSAILLRRPMDGQQNTVTAQGKDSDTDRTGIVIQHSRIVPDRRLFPDRFKIRCYLGRPWKKFSTTVVMESTIGDLIRPEGWLAWKDDFALDTLYYAEYNNRGPGSPTGGRVKWKGYRVINRRLAWRWTAGNFLAGRWWIPFSGVPHALGLVWR